jgi:2-phosphosulfolactate phosphatase
LPSDPAFDQAGYEIRCEWGPQGLALLAPTSDVLIIVDVLSFSTAVDVAASNRAIVYPYGSPDNALPAYATQNLAIVAEKKRSPYRFSLSPTSLLQIPAGHRLVLPSPNGGELCRDAGPTVTLTGCLRNATAVAKAAKQLGKTIAVIPSGERWPDGSLRYAIEDLLGAGAVLARLPGTHSPEAQLAVAAFEKLRPRLVDCLGESGSGRELIERGFPDDVILAAQVDVSSAVPILRDGAFTAL